MKQREVGIDLLKIISILGVVALHTQRSLDTGNCYNPILYYFGRFAMPVFFMVNGYLILKREIFDFSYYKKKILNIVRVLFIWGVITAVYYAVVYHKVGIKVFLWNVGKSIVARGVVPFWFLLTFVFLYTFVLLIGIDCIKKNINVITLVLGSVCLIFDIASLISIFRGGILFKIMFQRNFDFGHGDFTFAWVIG
jgi:surface polysaccharide O-acyltransferase-like enzyme